MEAEGPYGQMGSEHVVELDLDENQGDFWIWDSRREGRWRSLSLGEQSKEEDAGSGDSEEPSTQGADIVCPPCLTAL